MNASLLELFRTSYFWSPFCAWMLAQATKMLCGFTRTRRLDFRYLVSTGGMPSAHSAMATALATAVGVRNGAASPIFVLALAFAVIVMFDASTVRRAAGQQARLLNEIIDELFQEHHLSERKLKELLGHTRLEVFLGLLVGLFTGLLVTSLGSLFWPA